MTFYDALIAYRDQLKRHTGLKCVLSPVVIKESGPVVKIAMRKPLLRRISLAKGANAVLERMLRLVVTLEGVIESEMGLKYCLDASETFQAYLATQKNLEDSTGAGIPNSRITFSVDENDSVLEDPENGNKAWNNEVFYFEITIPQEGP